MTGYAGRISFEGDVGQSTELIDVAIKYANKVGAWKQTQGIPNVVKSFDLGDGRYCVVTDLQHMKSLHVVSPTTSDIHYAIPAFTNPAYPETAGVVDVVSGRVVKSTILTEKALINRKLVDVKVLKEFVPTATTENRYSDQERRRRLAVPEAPMFSTGADGEFSEHTNVRPSMYTGAMRRLVQLLLGVGFVIRPTYEERWVANGQKSFVSTDQIGENVHSAFGLYNAESFQQTPYVQLQYDYRHGKTHGISFDAANKPWLVEISTRGVYAMPLYMDPVSQTEAGRKRYLEVSPELKDFFDEFHGFPLGVTVPTDKTFTTLKKAGEIVQLLSSDDMHEFYQHSAYTSDLGWAFSPDGGEAHLTCMNYEAGIGVGFHYTVNLNITGETLPDWTDATRAVVSGLALTKMYEVKKARRMSGAQASDILDRLRVDPQGARDAFDSLEVTPTLAADANLKMARKGWLYHPAKPKAQPQIKFPMRIIDGIVSWDFGRLEGFNAPTDIVCNTPMFVSYVGKRLEVLYYYYDTRPRSYPPTNTRQKCQYAGSWKVTYAKTDAMVVGNFYSTSLDWRQVRAATESYSTFTSEEFCRYDVAGTIYPVSTCFAAFRMIVFRQEETMVSESGITGAVSVTIPFNDRSCYYMAHKTSLTRWPTNHYARNEFANGGIRDVYVIRANPGGHFVTCDIEPATSTARYVGSSDIQGSCFADVKADRINYSVTSKNIGTWRDPYYLFFITAPWGPISLGWVEGVVEYPKPNLLAETYTQEGAYTNVQTYKLFMVNDSGHGIVKIQSGSIETDLNASPNIPDVPLSFWWWTVSPNNYGDMARLFETYSCLGNNLMVYEDDIGSGVYLAKGGPENMVENGNTCYTGVIE